MSDKKVNANIGTGPVFLLFLVFLILKLCDVIDWSWWWVTAPLWIPLAVALLILLLIVALKTISIFKTN